jgi:REP element-mobilizing transposase RayT
MKHIRVINVDLFLLYSTILLWSTRYEFKGKAAIHMARTFMGRRKNSTGHHCWARGYSVSTVGRDEAVIREYIRTQEAEDRRLDHMALW